MDRKGMDEREREREREEATEEQTKTERWKTKDGRIKSVNEIRAGVKKKHRGGHQ